MERSIGTLDRSKDYGKRKAESQLLPAGAAERAFVW